jgi:hypothetical protein
MDISTLTSLINAFRAETKQGNFTPYSLGQARETTAIQQITQWNSQVGGCL